MFEQESEQLRRRLATSAGRHAHQALRSYKDDDGLGFYLRAGTALELAIKARLVSHSLLLIAPASRSWFEEALKFARSSGEGDERLLRSVSAPDALKRLRALEPDFDEAFDLRVSETIDRWNLAKHLGLAADPPADELVQHAASFVRAIAALLRKDFDEFWDEHAATARAMLDDGVSQAKVRVADAVAEAKSALVALAPEVLADAREQARDYFLFDVDHFVSVEVECPVCGSMGIAAGETFDDGDVDHGGGPDDEPYWVPVPTTQLATFQCRVCGLKLPGPDLVAAAGLPARVVNPRVTGAELAEALSDSGKE